MTGEGKNDAIFFTVLIKSILGNVNIATLPKDRQSSNLASFLNCLGQNCSFQKAYYKYFVYGDNGRPGYLKLEYPRILSLIITRFRENTLYLFTEDSDNYDNGVLQRNWKENTISTLNNRRFFGRSPNYNSSSIGMLKIEMKNNNFIKINHCLIPNSLEFQVASVHMEENRLDIENYEHMDRHDFLREVSTKLEIEEKELIRLSFDLLQNENWVRVISRLIENFI